MFSLRLRFALKLRWWGLPLALALAGTKLPAGDEAGVSMPGSAPMVAGATLIEAPPPSRHRAIGGPRPGIIGITSVDRAAELHYRLHAPLPGKGSLMFWFRTDRNYRSGADAPTFTQKLIDIPDALSVIFGGDETAVTLRVEWGGRQKEVGPRQIRIILPEFPGPAWHHFAVYWNGAAGEVNAFLDGTPYYVPGEKLQPWPVQTGHDLVMHLSRFGLADVRVSESRFTGSELRAAVGAGNWGALDGLLGAKDLGSLSVDERRGETLYARTLAQDSEVGDWKLEGPGKIEFREGWMEMKSLRPDAPAPGGNIVYWCPENFPTRFAAEWEFALIGEKGLCIVFFAAQGQDGRDLFDPTLARRTGVFPQYTQGDINCYHISYFANTPDEPRSVSNLRKDSGFYVIANGPIGVPVVKPGAVHRALLIKDGAHIEMAVDGRKIIDYTDDGRRAGPVWTSGKFGLRQMKWTVGRYRNFRVYALK